MSQPPIFAPQRCQVDSPLAIADGGWFDSVQVPQAPGDIADCDSTGSIPLPPLTPLCPGFQAAQATHSVVQLGREGFTLNVVNAACCDFAFYADVDFPCAEFTPIGEPFNYTGRAATSHTVYLPQEQQRLSFGFSSSSGPTGDCAWDLDMEVDFPCPQILPVKSKAVQNIVRPFPDKDFRYRFQFMPQCEWELYIEMAWPCPQFKPVEPRDPKVEEVVRYQQRYLTFEFTYEEECQWDFNMEIGWPCTAFTPQYPQQRYEPEIDEVVPFVQRYLRYKFNALPECEWELEMEIGWPCPQLLPEASKRQARVLGGDLSTLGRIGFQLLPDDDCTWNLDMEVKWACVGMTPRLPQGWREAENKDVVIPQRLFAHNYYHLAFGFQAGEECDWDLDIEVAWPCESMMPQWSTANPWTTKANAPVCGYGEMTYGFVWSANCEWLIEEDLLVPKPFDILFSSTMSGGTHIAPLGMTCSWCPQFIQGEWSRYHCGPQSYAWLNMTPYFEETGDCEATFFMDWKFTFEFPSACQGITGPDGPGGNDGPPGPIGPTGDPGPQGSSGDRGPVGANNGTQGPHGAGCYGSQGQQGPQGPYGPTGLPGGAGPPGDDSETEGPVGDLGPAGPKGKSGKPAILEVADRCVGLFCTEMPAAMFRDSMHTVIPKNTLIWTVPIDPDFLKVCDTDTLRVVGLSPNRPVLIGAKVDNGNVVMYLEKPCQPIELDVYMLGTRRGFRKRRFPRYTQAQMKRNDKFWASAWGEP